MYICTHISRRTISYEQMSCCYCRFTFFISFGVLHFIRPLHKCAACIYVYISSCLALCFVLLCEGNTATNWTVLLFYLLLVFFSLFTLYFFLFGGWLFGVYFSRVFLCCMWLCKYIMKWGHTAHHAHTNTHVNVFLASNVLLLFSLLTAVVVVVVFVAVFFFIRKY